MTMAAAGTTPYGNSNNNTSNNSNSNNSNNNNFPIIRRRDKRRHFSSTALDLRDPFEYVALAIRFDESRPESEQLLQTPLEDGRLYDNTLPFQQALEYLQKKTAPPLRLSALTQAAARKKKLKAVDKAVLTRHVTSSSSSSSPNAAAGQQSQQQPQPSHQQQHQQPSQQQQHQQQQQQQQQQHQQQLIQQYFLSPSQQPQQEPPVVALTPIILSGLLAAIKNEQHSTGASTTPTPTKQQLQQQHQDTCSELVLYCLSMRRVALQRVRNRRRRYHIQSIVLPLCSLILLAAMMMRNLHLYSWQLREMSFVDSCNFKKVTGIYGGYLTACRRAEAQLHSKFKSYLLNMRQVKQEKMLSFNETFICPGEDCLHDEIDENMMEAPFMMHTSLQQDVITKRELETPHPSTRPDRRGYHDGRVYTRPAPIKYVDKKEVQWLGYSTVNHLVRSALDVYLPQSKFPRRVMDVGCGIAGLFFALYQPRTLTPEEAKKKKLIRTVVNYKNRLQYTGITISKAEMIMAREIILHHGITDIKDVTIDLKSFDDPLPRGFTATIAIESLSYSRHLPSSLNNLMEATTPGGIMIIVEDVVVDHSRRRNKHSDPRPSLLTHTEWMAALDKVGCRMLHARDLSLEYELMGNPSMSPETMDKDNFNWDWLMPYWLVGNWVKKNGSVSAKRMVEMHEDKAAAREAYVARRMAYRDTNMGYHLYVCRKTRLDF
jgi:hypothetical protein